MKKRGRPQSTGIFKTRKELENHVIAKYSNEFISNRELAKQVGISVKCLERIING